MNIEKEIENLKHQAKHNEKIGYIELAQQQRQYVLWLKELQKYRKQNIDLVQAINRYDKATCKITPSCDVCDAWNEEEKCCELGLEEEEKKWESLSN